MLSSTWGKRLGGADTERQHHRPDCGAGGNRVKVANSMVTALFFHSFSAVIVAAILETHSGPWQAVMTNEDQITAISPASIVSNVGNPGQW